MKQIKKIKLKQIQKLHGSEFMYKRSLNDEFWSSFVEETLIYPILSIGKIRICFDMKECQLLYIQDFWSSIDDDYQSSLGD